MEMEVEMIDRGISCGCNACTQMIHFEKRTIVMLPE